jgi:hypothetical protein
MDPMTVRLMPDVAEEIARRHRALAPGDGGRGRDAIGRGTIINRDLGRYYDALKTARRALRPRLSREECLLICDVLNGTICEPYIPGMVAIDVEDSLPDNIAAKWGVPAAPLLATLRALTEIEERALIDAVERWWLRGDGDAPLL